MKVVVLSFIAGASLTLTGCSSFQSKTQTVEQAALSQNQKMVDELIEGFALYFNHNSSMIDEKYNIYLIAASNFLKMNKDYILTLEGHTDNNGGPALNKRISLERANAVRYQMIREYGATPSQIVTVGMGLENPIASNDTPDGRAENRRVVATLNKGTEP